MSITRGIQIVTLSVGSVIFGIGTMRYGVDATEALITYDEQQASKRQSGYAFAQEYESPGEKAITDALKALVCGGASFGMLYGLSHVLNERESRSRKR